MLTGLALLVAGCGRTPTAPPGAPFDPVAFFTGRSHGDATLKVLLKSPVSVSVESFGVPDGKGGLRLIQRIREGAKPARTRRWWLTPIGHGRWGGYLTDARGQVEVRAEGRGVRIHYRMPNGLAVDQLLVPLPGGKALDNRMDVTKWGIRLARLHEKIRHR